MSDYISQVAARVHRWFLLAAVAFVALSGGIVLIHDLVLYRNDSLLSWPTHYCRISIESAAERHGVVGGLTTASADSGCLQGETHLCGYGRFLLDEVIEAKPPPC